MKSRMGADLRAAMKEGRPHEARLIRVLIAAIDNAEAPPLQADRSAMELNPFREGSAEVERLSLTPAQLRAILMAEISEREAAAAEMQRLAQTDHADALRTEVLLTKRYVD